MSTNSIVGAFISNQGELAIDPKNQRGRPCLNNPTLPRFLCLQRRFVRFGQSLVRFCHRQAFYPRAASLGSVHQDSLFNFWRAFLRPQESRRRRAKHSPEMPAKVRLVVKPARLRNLFEADRLARSRHKLPRSPQAEPQEVVVGSEAGSLEKAAGEVTRTQAHLGRQLPDANLVRKTLFQQLDRAPNARIHARGVQPRAGLIVYRAKLRYRYPRLTQIRMGSENKKIAFFLVRRATVRRDFVNGHAELRKSGSLTFVKLCVLKVYYGEMHGNVGKF
jgi:hypothetical protein